MPQVANVVRAKSAAGLAPLSAELETVGLLIAVTYGFVMGLPFSAFGETVVSRRAGAQEEGAQSLCARARHALGVPSAPPRTLKAPAAHAVRSAVLPDLPLPLPRPCCCKITCCWC